MIYNVLCFLLKGFLMPNKISFCDLQNTCQALHEFAEARSKVKPDKDVILTVKKIDGRDVLKATRLSKMKWFARLVRWFGFGDATLKAVAPFLERHEPKLPSSFSRLQDKDFISMDFTEKAVDRLTHLTKEEYIKLKMQKARGCEVFKRCLSHHNKGHRQKVYILLQETEKKALRGHGNFAKGGIYHSYPNPMGPYPLNGDEKKLHERYRLPVIDKNEFAYLQPFFRHEDKASPQAMGFCYEYGLGTKRDIEKARINYENATFEGEYSACYNLGRLCLENDLQNGIDPLLDAEEILLEKITRAQKVIDDIRLKPAKVRNHDIFDDQVELSYVETKEEYEDRMQDLEKHEREYAPYFKKWSKALAQTYLVLIESYKKRGNFGLKKLKLYEQKAEQLKQKLGH